MFYNTNLLKICLFSFRHYFLQGSVAVKDSRLLEVDVVTSIELIEHLESEVLTQFPVNVFGQIRPKHVILSTPNVEFNVLFNKKKQFRHWDHKFEWTRSQFKVWCDKICDEYGYKVYFTGVGKPPTFKSEVGFCSQFAVFTRLIQSKNTILENHLNYILLKEIKYPHIDLKTVLAQIISAASHIANQNLGFFMNKQTELMRKQNVKSRTFGKSLMFAYPNKCMLKFSDTDYCCQQFEDVDNLKPCQNSKLYNHYGHFKTNVLVFPQQTKSQHALYPIYIEKKTKIDAEQFNDSGQDASLLLKETLQLCLPKFPHLSYFEVSVNTKEIVTICLSRIEILKETIDKTSNYILVDENYLYIPLSYLNHLKEKYHYPYQKVDDLDNGYLR